MRKNFIIILCYIIPLLSIGQNQYYQNIKHDNTWIFGFGSWGNSFMTFDTNKVQIKRLKPTKLSMSYCTSIMSDTDGKLLFFTNGVSIMNKDFKIIKNGNRINPGPFMELYNWTDDGLPIIQGTLSLSFPNNDSIYQLLHQDTWVISQNSKLYSYSPFYYSTINMKMNNGLGEVTHPNTPIYRDSVSEGQLTACRHANGRDWWVICKLPYKTIFNTYLVTPDTVTYQFQQNTQNDNYESQEPFGQSMFTNNGERFITITGNELRKPAYFNIYDFDRCSGVLSNHQRIIFTDSIYGVLGGAVSSNSRYLYVSRYDYILQFDLEANNILASMDTVAKYDGFKSPVTGCPTTFFLSQLAPDGKIYISVAPCATEYLTVINDPNKKGKDCNVQQHAIYLEVNNSWEVPNSPNYKLGALKGSGCDTLVMVGNKELDKVLDKITLVPNPASDVVRLLNLPTNLEVKIEIVNLQGNLLKTKTFDNSNSTLELSFQEYPSGIYFIRVSSNQQLLSTNKLVIIK